MFSTGSSANAQHFHAFHIEGIARWNLDRAKAWAPPSSHLRCYSTSLTQDVDQQAQRLLGKGLQDLVSSGDEQPNVVLRQPEAYTGIYDMTLLLCNYVLILYLFSGEKIGIDYLHSQTGQAMVNFGSLEENEIGDVELEDIPEDEIAEVVDFTLVNLEEGVLPPLNVISGLICLSVPCNCDLLCEFIIEERKRAECAAKAVLEAPDSAMQEVAGCSDGNKVKCLHMYLLSIIYMQKKI